MTLMSRNAPVVDWCGAELIQFLERIQPHGFVMELSSEWLVTRASLNVDAFLGTSAGALIGMPAADVFGTSLVHDFRGKLQILPGKDAVELLIGRPLPRQEALFDFAIHRVNGRILVEAEPAAQGDDKGDAGLQEMAAQLRHAADIGAIASLAVRHVRAATGFDRCMVYRFNPDDSGEIIAESKRAHMPSFLGLRFPAGDIPPQARALYLRDSIRLVADVGAASVPVVPRADASGAALDLSMSGLRAQSPSHIEYLKNMGVAASMSISIIVDGALWGLITCHHARPRGVPIAIRRMLDLYAHLLSAALATALRVEAVACQTPRRLQHEILLSHIGSEAASLGDLFEPLETIARQVRADGLAMFVGGRLRLSGETPTAHQISGIIQHVGRVAPNGLFQTNHINCDYPPAADFAADVAGMVAIPISRITQDYVLLFRREQVSRVKWAGAPLKESVTADDGTVRIVPRKDFSEWQETIRDRSEPWSEIDIETAEDLRIALLEISLQLSDTMERRRKKSTDQQDILIAELNHRVRNILNLIIGLVRQCADSARSVKDFSTEVYTRVHALARAHDQLTSNGWGARSLENMIRVEAGAYLGAKADRVIIRGDEVALQPDAFTTVALVIHELITNSAKYGAFRDSHGSVTIDLHCDDDTGVTVRWKESGGAAVTPPTRRGFGSTIIERAIPHELGGTASVAFEPDGLRAHFTLPALYVAECVDADIGALSSAKFLPNPDGGKLNGATLLVEDNLLIALETESMLRSLGASEVHVASNVAGALEHLSSARPAFAVLDYNLGREQSVAVAERLVQLEVPFIFATGYGDTAMIDARFRDRPVLTKPYSAASVMNAYLEIGNV